MTTMTRDTVGRLLSGSEEDEAKHAILLAGDQARFSTCARAKCGALVVTSGGIILGRGFNSPPGLTPARCGRKHELGPGFKSDRTCCVHAEIRALRQAWKKYDIQTIQTARLYFARLGGDGKATPSGDPYCTICSKEALDVGVAEWALLHEEGIRVYPAEAYHDLSFAYGAVREFNGLDVLAGKGWDR